MSLGRPPLPPEQKRTIRKEVRLSEAEYARLCSSALKSRSDISTFIRDRLFTPDPLTVRIKNTEHA